MIYQKIKNGTETELKELTFEQAVQLAGTDSLVFDSSTEEMNFYKEVAKTFPAPSNVKPKEMQDSTSLTELFPFLEEDQIHDIIVKYFDDDNIYHNLDISEILPFASIEDCDILFQKALEANLQNIDVVEIAPFVSEDGLSHFVDAYVEGRYADAEIDSLYPFLAPKDIKRLIDYFLAKPKEMKDSTFLTELFPFLEENQIHDIIVKYFDDDNIYHNLDISEILPFASKEDCDNLFQKALDTKLKDISVVEIAPFVSEDSLSHFVDAYVEGRYADAEIDSLYPYLAPKDIKRLIEYFLSKKNSD